MLSLFHSAAGLASAQDFEVSLHLHSIADTAAQDRLFWRVATPGSPDYLRFKNVSQLADIFGAPQTAIAEAGAFVTALGGTDVRVSALRDVVTASFPGAAADEARWSPRGLPRASAPAGVALVTRRDFGTLAPEPPSKPRVASGIGSYTITQQKDAYGIPEDLAATNDKTSQMVWGPGTFGYSPAGLKAFAVEQCPLMNTAKVNFDTENHGEQGGDNFGEGTLDVHMIASFGLNVSTLVSNTNTSSSTEEGSGFGLALLDFLTQLASRDTVPQVLSMSLGSLSAASCDLLCSEASKGGDVTLPECEAFLQSQRQVCMYRSTAQVAKIDAALMALGLRGVTILGSSGDGGSHWSFGKFPSTSKVGRALNKVGCEFMFPIYPSPSPYMVSVGGTEWERGDPTKPVMWQGFGGGSGGGFSWQCAQPAFQKEAVTKYLGGAGMPPATSFNASGRAYPDISAVAVDGTSQSSPSFAGIWSLIMDARLNAGLPPLGPLGPRIWQVAQQFPGAAFEDVTSGNSKTSCDSGFPAAEGWDPTTGWGRPVWKGLVEHFASDATLR